jgi:hypothetical protein
LVSSHEHGNGLQVAKKAGYFLINWELCASEKWLHEVNACANIFLGDQLCQSTMMMVFKEISETLVFSSKLTSPTIWENFSIIIAMKA